jgi:hypothetical protein
MAVIEQIDLKRHAKVRANIDLPGVPAGMDGKVLVVSGVTWIRYRVLFANGVEHGLLDGRHLVRPKDFIPVDERVDEVVAEVPSTNGEDAAGDGAGAGPADNPFGIPAHLMERTKKAHERLGLD